MWSASSVWGFKDANELALAHRALQDREGLQPCKFERVRLPSGLTRATATQEFTSVDAWRPIGPRLAYNLDPDVDFEYCTDIEFVRPATFKEVPECRQPFKLRHDERLDVGCGRGLLWASSKMARPTY